MTRCATAELSLAGLASNRCPRSATARRALNGTAAPRPKTRVGSEICVPARPRRPWVSIGVALVAIASVVAGELWAFREAPALASKARSEVAADLDSTVARVVSASILIAPAN